MEIFKTSDPASFVGLPEFESGTPSPPDLYANQLRYSPKRVGKKSPIRLFTIAKKIEAVNSCSSCAVHVQFMCSSCAQCTIPIGQPRHLQRARSAKFPAPLATSAKREVPRANDRAAAGSAADFLRYTPFFREYGFPVRLLCLRPSNPCRIYFR